MFANGNSLQEVKGELKYLMILKEKIWRLQMKCLDRSLWCRLDQPVEMELVMRSQLRTFYPTKGETQRREQAAKPTGN